MNDLLRRQSALEQTLEKYRDAPLDYKTADCARMLRFHLLKMGHKPPALPKYQSATGAIRALRNGGIIAVLDSFLTRIPHARMLPGDVAVLEGENGMDAGVICVGFKVIGFHEGSEVMVNLIPLEVKAAWRA